MSPWLARVYAGLAGLKVGLAERGPKFEERACFSGLIPFPFLFSPPFFSRTGSVSPGFWVVFWKEGCLEKMGKVLLVCFFRLTSTAKRSATHCYCVQKSLSLPRRDAAEALSARE